MLSLLKTFIKLGLFAVAVLYLGQLIPVDEKKTVSDEIKTQMFKAREALSIDRVKTTVKGWIGSEVDKSEKKGEIDSSDSKSETARSKKRAQRKASLREKVKNNKKIEKDRILPSEREKLQAFIQELNSE